MLLLIPALLCAGCAAELSEYEKVDRLTVPAVKEYTPSQQTQAAVEMEKYCSQVLMLCEMINDFGRMRDAARAALGLKVDTTR